MGVVLRCTDINIYLLPENGGRANGQYINIEDGCNSSFFFEMRLLGPTMAAGCRLLFFFLLLIGMSSFDTDACDDPITIFTPRRRRDNLKQE